MNIVLFDGVCNLCNATVLFLIKHNKNNNLHFAAQQTATGTNLIQQYKLGQHNSSVVFIKEDKVFYSSDAVIEIAKCLSGWPRLFQYSIIIPRRLRNALYNFVAKNRFRFFGKRQTCSVPSKEHLNKFL